MTKANPPKLLIIEDDERFAETLVVEFRDRGYEVFAVSSLSELRAMAKRPVLIGTWADAVWAVRFYQKHGFRLVPPLEKDRLLETYWSVPARQAETSVVLADQTWWNQNLA